MSRLSIRLPTGKPLGDPIAQGDTQPEENTFDGTVSTVARVGFRFFDFSGYTPPGWMTRSIRYSGGHVFSGLGIPVNPIESTRSTFSFRPNLRVHEDVSFFGPLGFLLVLPLAAGFIVAGAARRAPPATVLLAAALPLYTVGIALGFRYNLWLGRFMIAPVALTMPLAAFVYRWRLIAAALAAVGVLGLYYTHTKNELKPVGFNEQASVWRMDRAQEQTVVRPYLLEVFRGVEQYVGPKDRLGVVLGFDDWDYPLYGSGLKRRLVPVPQANMLQFAERHRLHWLLLDRDAFRPQPRAQWTAVEFRDGGWTMYLRPEELD